MKKFLSRIQINNTNIFKNKKKSFIDIHELSDRGIYFYQKLKFFRDSVKNFSKFSITKNGFI